MHGMAKLPVDTAAINEALEILQSRIGADAVFLVDVNGFLLAGTSAGEKFDLESIASLSAGNYLSGLELAKLFRIDDYQSFFLGSTEKVDYFQIGGEGIFLAVLHPRRAPLSEVVSESKNAIVSIGKLYQKARREMGGLDVIISDRRMFSIPQPPLAFGLSGQSQSAPSPSEPPHCSFCGRSGEQVKKLVKASKAMICDECIKVISEVLFVDLL